MARRPMILLVDDQADVRFMISLYLEDEQVDFDEAASAGEAVTAIRSKTYDAILLDQTMPPGPNGIELAETLRAQGHDVPIVLYSAYLDPTVEQRAHALGLRTVDKGDPTRLIEALRLELTPAP